MEIYGYSKDLIDYYNRQVFKMLGLFEAKDPNAFRHSIKIVAEMSQLPLQIGVLDDDYRFGAVLNKVNLLVDEIFYLDGEHQFVKNLVMESCNLLEEIKEGL